MPDLFSPLPDFRLPVDARLPLAACVRYSHLAAVARWKTIGEGSYKHSEWRLGEGVVKGWRPRMSFVPIGAHEFDLELGFVEDEWYSRLPADRRNKTVIVWPQAGEACLIGLVRRGVGQSYGSRGSSGLFDDDWEPGGFTADGYLALYALKAQLEGVAYMLAPTWAVSLAR